jgi:hypothetical protein
VISADKITNSNNEFGINDGWSSLEFGNDDNFLEQILRKIEVAHLQVHKLKTRIDKVISENPGKYYSVNKLTLLAPSDALASSDQDPASPPDSRHRLTVRSLCNSSRHVSECNMGDLPMLESTVLSHGEVNPLSNIIESMAQPQVADFCENVSISFVTSCTAFYQILGFRILLGSNHDHVSLLF